MRQKTSTAGGMVPLSAIIKTLVHLRHKDLTLVGHKISIAKARHQAKLLSRTMYTKGTRGTRPHHCETKDPTAVGIVSSNATIKTIVHQEHSDLTLLGQKTSANSHLVSHSTVTKTLP